MIKRFALFLFFYFLLCICSGNDAKPCHAPPWACEQKTQAKLANCCVCSAWQYKRSLIPTASGIDMHWMAFFSCLAHLIFGMPKKQRGYPGGDSLFFFFFLFLLLSISLFIFISQYNVISLNVQYLSERFFGVLLVYLWRMGTYGLSACRGILPMCNKAKVLVAAKPFSQWCWFKETVFLMATAWTSRRVP